MSKYNYKGTGNTGSFAWFMQRISGLCIAFTGFIVFVQIATTRNPNKHSVDPWLIMPLLSFGIWHTFSGFKMITDDYVSNAKCRFALQTLYWFLGVTTFLTGVYSIISHNI